MTKKQQTTSKIHRHLEPKFNGVIPNIVAAKRFSAALKKHDWNKNKFIYNLRCERQQRVTVRAERRETYNALAMAMISKCDYNPESEYIFEIMCSVEELAKLSGQLYTNGNGRKTYDPILHAIRDWRDAGLIIVLRGKDYETRQEKAMRIWVKPEFFNGLGFSIKELRNIANEYKKWMVKHGLTESYKKKYLEHIQRIAKSNVADLRNKHSLKNLLKKLKRLVLGNESLEKEKKQTISQIELQLLEIKKQSKKDKEPFKRAYLKLELKLPRIQTLSLENKIRKEFPYVKGEEFYKLLIESINKT